MKLALVLAISFLCLLNLWYTQPIDGASLTVEGAFTPHTGP